MRYEGLAEFRAELIERATGTTLSDAGRALALDLVEELDAAIVKINNGTWTCSMYPEQDDCDDLVRELHVYVTLSGRWHDFLKPPSTTVLKPCIQYRANRTPVAQTPAPVEELF
jgi:hypothetical protein